MLLGWQTLFSLTSLGETDIELGLFGYMQGYQPRKLLIMETVMSIKNDKTQVGTWKESSEWNCLRCLVISVSVSVLGVDCCQHDEREPKRPRCQQNLAN